MMLIECLTGRREYPGVPVEAAVARLHRLPTVPPWDPAERPSAGECAAAVRTPGNLIPALPETAATPFGADDETAWVSPAVARPTAGEQRSGRRMSAALVGVAVTAAVGVAVIAFSPDVENAASRTL
jgi:eukaryotic-like serine/threonine-protein kinase